MRECILFVIFNMMENVPEISNEEVKEKTEDDGMPMWVQVVSLLFTVIATVYCIYARTWHDIIKYSAS